MIDNNYSKENPMWIRNDVRIKFSFADRLRILFGKTAHCDSKLFVDRFCEIAKPSESKSYVDKIITHKPISYEQQERM